MTSLSSRPVARLTSPADLVATVPALCGFRPQDSVVLLSLRGTRLRLGLTIRLDLPAAPDVDACAELLAERLLQDGACAAVLILYADEPRPVLADAVAAALVDRGVRLVEALHVRQERWTSYTCSGPCCPATGTPVGEPPSLVRAEHALDGRVVLGSREELVQALAPPQEPAPAAARAASPAEVRQALSEVAAGAALEAAAAARIALALHDVRVRDEVATWALEDGDGLLALLHQVVRQVGAPWDAPPCTVLAQVAYCRGDGARANVALDRALRSDPQHGLALLLRAALDGALPPAEVRRTLQATAAALRRARS